MRTRWKLKNRRDDDETLEPSKRSCQGAKVDKGKNKITSDASDQETENVISKICRKLENGHDDETREQSMRSCPGAKVDKGENIITPDASDQDTDNDNSKFRWKLNNGHDDDETLEQSMRSCQGAKVDKGKNKITSDASDQDTDNDNSKLELTRWTRGRTHMGRLAVRMAKGVKKDVTFNHLGQTVGKEGAEMQSYIGVLARQKVSINCNTWKQVPNDIKELIWDSVNLVYNVDPKWKKGCLRSANDKWRQYKTHLTQEHVFKNLNNPEKLNKPPDGYGISQEDWSSFVNSRLSEDFQKLSQEQKDRRKSNIYPHLLSRKGYSGLAEEIADELGDDVEINRAILWKRGRMNQEGEFEGEGLLEKVKVIDEFIEKKRQGKLNIEELDDGIIPKALQSKEHSGRVRGVGGHITPTTYFSIGRGKMHVKNHMNNDFQKELMRTKRKIDEHEARIEKLEAAVFKRHAQNFDNDEKDSCSIKFQSPANEDEIKSFEDCDDVHILKDDEHLQGKPVALTLESSMDVVAYGTIISVKGQKLHAAQFPKNCMCISIDEAVNKSAPLPIPDEYENIGDAVGTEVAWPKQLILMQNEKPRKRKSDVQVKKHEPDAPKSLRMLYCYGNHALQGRDNTIPIHLDSDVFAKDHAVYVHLEDITQVYELSSVSCTCIIVYIWHLYKKMKEENKLERFIYMNPHALPYFPAHTLDEEKKIELMDKKAHALAIRLCHASPNQLVLVPCNVGEHWILTIIDPYKEIVYILDSLNHRMRDLDWRYVVNTSLTLFNARKKRRVKKQPTWEVVQGPRQPDAVQCGFYVMRYMREIIEKVATIDRSSLQSIFTKKDYTRAEIDVVRSEWAECVQDYIY